MKNTFVKVAVGIFTLLVTGLPLAAQPQQGDQARIKTERELSPPGRATTSPRHPAYPSLPSTRNAVAAPIPFEFIVKDKALPQGDYTISQFRGKLWLITNSEGESSFALTQDKLSPNKPNSTAQLVFNLYNGNRYFLHEIVLPGPRTVEVLDCGMEKAIVKTYWKLEQITLNLQNSSIERVTLDR